MFFSRKFAPAKHRVLLDENYVRDNRRSKIPSRRIIFMKSPRARPDLIQTADKYFIFELGFSRFFFRFRFTNDVYARFLFEYFLYGIA